MQSIISHPELVILETSHIIPRDVEMKLFDGLSTFQTETNLSRNIHISFLPTFHFLYLFYIRLQHKHKHDMILDKTPLDIKFK